MWALFSRTNPTLHLLAQILLGLWEGTCWELLGTKRVKGSNFASANTHTHTSSNKHQLNTLFSNKNVEQHRWQSWPTWPIISIFLKLKERKSLCQLCGSGLSSNGFFSQRLIFHADYYSVRTTHVYNCMHQHAYTHYKSQTLVFRYPFHPRVTAVAHKRPRSLCQKCRWQVTAKHAYTYVCGFAWRDVVHGCMVYTERAEMAAVSCGTSHAITVSTPLRWILKNKTTTKTRYKKLFTHVESHASAVSLLESG